MTTYSKITDYAAKDALLTGNPSKIVKGVEIGAEFDAIATADASNVKGPTVAVTDNALMRWDGTAGRDSQGSSATLADDGTLTATKFSGALNGTVGATTPSTGAFTTLSASGVLSFSGQDSYFGSATRRTYWRSDTNGVSLLTGAAQTGSGVYFDTANDKVQLFAASASRAEVTSTGLAVTGDFSNTGNTTLGDATTDTVTVNGYMGVGGAPSASKGLVLQNTISSTTPLGMDIRPALTATGGSLLASFATGTAGSLTANTGASINAYGCYLSEPNIIVTTGSVTNAATVFINEGPTEGGSINANLLTTAATGTNKWNIYASGTAANYFAGNVGIGLTTPSTVLEVRPAAETALAAENAGLLIRAISGSVNRYSFLNFGGSGFSGSIAQVAGLTTTIGTDYTTSAGALVLTTKAAGNATPTERLRIDSAGNIGLGVTPSAWYTSFGTKALQVGASASLVGLDVSASDRRTYLSNNSFLNGSGSPAYINSSAATQYLQVNGQHQWGTAPSGTAGNAITFTQSLAVGLGTTLALEGATSAAGTGIAFPATQLASSNANTLDDYEEGTFTPTLSTDAVNFTSVTYDPLRGGRYTKIGNVVHFQITMRTDAITVGSASGNVIISGLPFTAAANTGATQDADSAASCANSISWVTNQPSEAFVNANASTISLMYKATANGASTSLPFTDAATGANANNIRISGTYIAA